MTSQLPRLGLLGITGIGQMAPAAANTLSRASGRSNGGRRNGGRRNGGSKKKRARAGGAKKRRRSSSGKKPWMVKGSAAAKRHMAKLRRARKKK